MGHGGPRKGAGRKRGALTRKTREIAEKAVATGITPLEVMMLAMRAHVKAKRLDQAAAIAKDAAPYMHPRLAAVQHSGPNGKPIAVAHLKLPDLSDEQLGALEALFGPLATASGDDGSDQGGEG